MRRRWRRPMLAPRSAAASQPTAGPMKEGAWVVQCWGGWLMFSSGDSVPWCTCNWPCNLGHHAGINSDDRVFWRRLFRHPGWRLGCNLSTAKDYSIAISSPLARALCLWVEDGSISALLSTPSVERDRPGRPGEKRGNSRKPLNQPVVNKSAVT